MDGDFELKNQVLKTLQMSRMMITFQKELLEENKEEIKVHREIHKFWVCNLNFRF